MTIRTEVNTMALKDLFKMTKADRYTADGCEKLNRAREAATEDARRTYKNGEISQTTGLMKTPNGWVEPPKGKAKGVKSENKPAGKTPNVMELVHEEVKTKSPEQIKEIISKLRTPNSSERNAANVNPDILANVYEEELKLTQKNDTKPTKKYEKPLYIKMNEQSGFYEKAEKEKQRRKEALYNSPEEKRRREMLEKIEKGEVLIKPKTESKPARTWKEHVANVKPEVIKEMTPEQKKAVMNGKTYRNVKEGRGAIDITKADLEAAESKPAESKEALYSPRMEQWLNESPSKLSDKDLMRKNETLHSLGNSAKGEDFKRIMQAGIEIEKELAKRKLPSNPGGIGYEEAKAKAASKPTEKKPDGVDEEGNIKIPKVGMNVLVKVNGNRPGKIVDYRGDYVEVEMPARGAYPGRRDTYYKSDLKFDEEMKADALERSDAERATDAAPRVLTGDCKIRIKRETKDGTYTPESINAPREKLEKKLTGDCKIRVRK